MIDHFTVMDNLELCQNNQPIPDLLECSGFCSSHPSYNNLMRQLQMFPSDCHGEHERGTLVTRWP
ncbi:hypothetical protein DPMN_044797 [Dreissena polymorpha]|uniref:Uncharacterized protein n=1 Tax=Dreissena polymorpha TaxID=45954 RepID=A0A9D4D564_DREPO|nr:hypothetical protein DPMN_044797 [Dreissena polymorpha]